MQGKKINKACYFMCIGMAIFMTEDEILPVLGNVEAPFKLEVLLPVVVDKAGNGIVVAAGEDAAGGFFLLDCRRVSGELGQRKG